jgi:hypothetical protein
MIIPGVLAAVMIAPLHADDFKKFNFNIGGGVSTPLNPTGRYVGVSGNFVTGAGYNIDKHNSIIGEFMWAGMPGNRFVLQPFNAPFGRINLYTITTNYRLQKERFGHSPFGAYFIAGGGWYLRTMSVDKNYVVPDFTPCYPIFDWWGYACGPGGYVYTATVAHKSVSTGGVNGGGGFTIRLSDSGWKFYTEARYHYAFSRIPSTLVLVTFGLRFH